MVCQNCSRRANRRISKARTNPLAASHLAGGIYIHYAYPACSKLTRSRWESGAKTLQHAGAAKSPDDLTVYVVFLKCAKQGCASPVVLLAPLKNNLRDPDSMVQNPSELECTWGLCCEIRIWKQLDSESHNSPPLPVPCLGRMAHRLLFVVLSVFPVVAWAAPRLGS